ncbi:uncharacterized protein LOC144714229 [Wolffia australiana]
MAKKAGERGMEMAVSAATPLMLSKMNYRVWAMRMEVLVESDDLWSVMVDNDVPKKDKMALSVILSAVPEDVMVMLDAKKTAKENWEILRQRNLGMDTVIQSHIQEEREAVWRFLRATPSKFDALTLSLEQYGDLDKISLDEVIGSLTVHELRLKERETREEEQALLVKSMNKMKMMNEGASSSRGGGRNHNHGRGRGRGRSRGRASAHEEYRESKPFDKSGIQCYNCQRYGHFAYECRSRKKERGDRAFVAETTAAPVTASVPAPTATSSLLMAVE